SLRILYVAGRQNTSCFVIKSVRVEIHAEILRLMRLVRALQFRSVTITPASFGVCSCRTSVIAKHLSGLEANLRRLVTLQTCLGGDGFSKQSANRHLKPFSHWHKSAGQLGLMN